MSNKYSQFPGVVCERLRKLVDEADRAEADRDKAFSDRDEAFARTRDDGISASEKEHHEAEYGRQIMQIDILGKRINWCNGEIRATVKSARKAEQNPQASLPYQDADLDMPDFSPKVKAQERGAKKPDEPQVPDPDQMEFADGVDQQLAASPSELDMREDLKGRLQTAGFACVGDVAKYIDEDKDLAVHNFSEDEAKAIVKAVGQYRSRHRKAMVEAEQVA